MDKNVILIGDSCIGGLSTLKEIVESGKNYNFKFIVDKKNNPYGLKTTGEIVNYVQEWINALIDQDVNLIFIACNTASIAIEEKISALSAIYGIEIITMLDLVEECLDDNSSNIFSKNVALLGTKYTVESGKYQTKIRKYHPDKILNFVGTKLESVVASGEYKSSNGRMLIKDELSILLESKVDSILLGCTTFSLISEQIREILGNQICVLDPNIYVSRVFEKFIKLDEVKKSKPQINIYSTSSSEKDLETIKRYYKELFSEYPDISII